MSAAVYLDLESGAQRIALRAGEQAESESLGAVNSGDPETLEQFLLWAFDACPARRYVLVMAGLGIMDSDSVVGRPPFDAARLFAICDDRATNDAIELHELSAALKGAFPADGPRRLVMLACDMYAMQFMEVSYELRGRARSHRWHSAGRAPGRRATSPLALRAMSEALAGDRGDSHGSRGSAVAFRGRPPGAAARQGDRRGSRRALHQQSGKGHAGHGVRDRSRSPRACRAGARHVQRRVSAMVEQRRHLAGPRDGLQKPLEDARAIVELRPERSSDGYRRIAEARICGGRRPMGRRGGSSHAIPVAVEDAARDGARRRASWRQAGRARTRIAESPTRLPRAGLASSACSPSWPTKPRTASCPNTRSRRERSSSVFRSG